MNIKRGDTIIIGGKAFYAVHDYDDNQMTITLTTDDNLPISVMNQVHQAVHHPIPTPEELKERQEQMNNQNPAAFLSLLGGLLNNPNVQVEGDTQGLMNMLGSMSGGGSNVIE